MINLIKMRSEGAIVTVLLQLHLIFIIENGGPE